MITGNARSDKAGAQYYIRSDFYDYGGCFPYII